MLLNLNRPMQPQGAVAVRGFAPTAHAQPAYMARGEPYTSHKAKGTLKPIP